MGNGTPFLAIMALLRSIYPYLPDKVLLVAPIVLGGVGLYRLVRVRFGVGWAAAAYGGTLNVFNPFVADRYLAGHAQWTHAGFHPWLSSSPHVNLIEEPLTDPPRSRGLPPDCRREERGTGLLIETLVPRSP